jgi:hypothetical protein
MYLCFFYCPLRGWQKKPRLPAHHANPQGEGGGEAKTCLRLKGRENRRMLNKEYQKYRIYSFIILLFDVRYSIFNLQFLRDGESNSFDEAVSAGSS